MKTGKYLVVMLCLGLVFSAATAEADQTTRKAFQNSLSQVMKAANGPPGL